MQSNQIFTIVGVRLLLLTLALMIFTPYTVADDDSPYLPIKRMTMETANAIALAAVLECRNQGVQATATVVDKNGIVQAVVRDTLAPPVSITVSRSKAYTAANFSVATSGLERQASSALANVPGLMMGAGGVLIEAGGTIYGAVGVSGAPSGETDEACAKAGVDAVIDDLEMAE
ncbi:MAG: heme-binding protein [Gammaproteobacteria bacterium]|nr:heme-binding protein [Gammaproteobacteria bacterium]